ncbi:MAG: O-antigen ligase family protein [Pyramidobacter sp.]|nr:O-antigen ligase family protein [Pyramidobacter sp.]
MEEHTLNGHCADSPFRSFWFCTLFAVCLALPNLVYSGTTFFQTLHLMKWVVSLVPVGLMALSAGGSALLDGNRSRLRVDFFGCFWLLYALFITLQPLWVPLSSVSAWRREWFFFAGCCAFYLLAFSFFSERWLRPILWLASLNAAVNGIIAECQIRGFVSPFGPISLIMPTPGNYIGNTGQQNMFALWMALALFSSLFLFACWGSNFTRNLANKLAVSANLLFYVIIAWCLISSTSRSGILAFWVGSVMMSLCVFFTDRDRGKLRRIGFGIILFFIVFGVFFLADTGRGFSFLVKTRDMIENMGDLAARREIWQTSWEVFKLSPHTGVGLGQYKWHYLIGQRIAMLADPSMKWQFTYWAHNEILQWFCEFGIWGGAALLAAGLFWLAAFFRFLRQHRGQTLPAAFLWSSSFLFLIWFDALWTRPFHRIENSLWIALAFALSNRYLFKRESSAPARPASGAVCRAAGAFLLGTSVLGFWYGIDGVRGDLYLRAAESKTSDASEKQLLIQIARSYPMAEDLAERQLALLQIKLGETSKNMDVLADGLNKLIAVFRKQPTAEDYVTLMRYAQRSNIKNLLAFLERYSPPPRAQDTAISIQPQIAPSVGITAPVPPSRPGAVITIN